MKPLTPNQKLLIAHIKFMENYEQNPASLKTIKQKFGKEIDVEYELKELISMGRIWEPRDGIFRSLD